MSGPPKNRWSCCTRRWAYCYYVSVFRTCLKVGAEWYRFQVCSKILLIDEGHSELTDPNIIVIAFGQCCKYLPSLVRAKHCVYGFLALKKNETDRPGTTCFVQKSLSITCCWVQLCAHPHRIMRWHGTFRSDSQFNRPCPDIDIVFELYVTGVIIV